MLDPTSQPPAIVREAADLEALAAAINKAHESGEQFARRGMDYFRQAGEALLKAKKGCKHGQWLDWLKKHIKFSQPTVHRYMRVAKEWDKLFTMNNLHEAMAYFTDEPEPEAEPLVDAEGNLIPESALPAFRDARTMHQLGTDIAAIGKRFKELSEKPVGKYIQIEDVKIQVKNLKLAADSNRPTHVCPLCNGEKGDCRLCNGDGWTLAHVWKRISEERNGQEGRS